MSASIVPLNGQASASQEFTIPGTKIIVDSKAVWMALTILGGAVGGFWGLLGGAMAGYAVSSMIENCRKKGAFENAVDSMVTNGHITSAARQEVLNAAKAADFDQAVASLIEKKVITHGNGFYILMAQMAANGQDNDCNKRLAASVQKGDIRPGPAYHVLRTHRTGENAKHILASSNVVLSFLDGGRDTQGRTYDEILDWNDDQLERVHDWVQQLFVTQEKSAHHPAPDKWIATDTIASAIRADPVRQQRMQRAYARVLQFYQLDRTLTVPPNWVTPGNHNFLRITRIIKSLKLAGLDKEARDFMRRLTAVCNLSEARQSIGSSFKYWTQAAM